MELNTLIYALNEFKVASRKILLNLLLINKLIIKNYYKFSIIKFQGLVAR